MRDHVVVYAAYDTDWHLYLTCPQRGPLGYCTAVGPDEPFDPAAATRTLAQAGWTVAQDGWTSTPPHAEYPYLAHVTRAP